MSIISLKKLILTSLLSQRLVCIVNYPKTVSIRLPCVLHARAVFRYFHQYKEILE